MMKRKKEKISYWEIFMWKIFESLFEGSIEIFEGVWKKNVEEMGKKRKRQLRLLLYKLNHCTSTRSVWLIPFLWNWEATNPLGGSVVCWIGFVCLCYFSFFWAFSRDFFSLFFHLFTFSQIFIFPFLFFFFGSFFHFLSFSIFFFAHLFSFGFFFLLSFRVLGICKDKDIEERV